MEFRAARGSSNAANISNGRAAAAGLAAALQSLLPEDFVFQEEFYCPQDTDIFLPTGALPAQPTGAIAIADYTPVMRGTATTFSGKGGPSKARVSVFGVFWDPSDVDGPAANGAVDSGEDATVAGALTFLATATGLRSIANEAVVWYPRATVKCNDHYVKLARRLFP
jgi:hypothetical protein